MRASSLRRRTRVTCSAISAARGGFGWSSRANIARSCDIVRAGLFSPQPGFLRLQEPQGQQREGHVMVPAHPRPDLVMPQADFAFAGPEQFLSPVPPAV